MSEQAPEGAAQFELVPPKELGSTMAIYSNFAQATISPFDMTLHFGWYALPPLTEPPSETVKVEVRPLVKVTLPLNLVRATIQLLQRQLDAWEQTFGEAAADAPQAVRLEDAENRV